MLIGVVILDFNNRLNGSLYIRLSSCINFILLNTWALWWFNYIYCTIVVVASIFKAAGCLLDIQYCELLHYQTLSGASILVSREKVPIVKICVPIMLVRACVCVL